MRRERCFKNLSTGRNTIEKWMRSFAKKIRIDMKSLEITNHSNTAAAVAQLLWSAIREQQAIKIARHRCSNLK